MKVFAVIMDFFATGQPVVSELPINSDTSPQEGDSEVVASIKV
jgi:hypothetical protein